MTGFVGEIALASRSLKDSSGGRRLLAGFARASSRGVSGFSGFTASHGQLNPLHSALI